MTTNKHFAHLVTETANRETHGGPEILVYPEWDGVNFTPPIRRRKLASMDDEYEVLREEGWKWVEGTEVREPARGYYIIQVEEVCRCGDSLDLHIGGKPCVYGKNDAKNLRDLPIYKWASSELDH